MTASNSYTGPTLIDEGALKLSGGGSIASDLIDVYALGVFDVLEVAPYSLGPGKTIQGTGDVMGELLIDGGTVAPGASPGILTTESVTFGDGSTLAMEIGGTDRGDEYDVLVSTGTITLQAGSTLDVTLIDGFGPGLWDTFDLLDFADLDGTFTTVNLPGLNDLSWNTDSLYTTGEIQVVPEPVSAIVLLLGAIAGLGRRPRR